MSDISPEVDEFLAHYGVKGMKWGVRRSKEELAGRSKTPDPKSLGINTSVKVSSMNKGRVGEGEGAVAVIIGVYGTLVAAQAVMQYRDSGRKDAKKTGDKEFKKNPELAKKMSVDQLEAKVVKHINPGYGERGTQMNCRRATMAYEMRRRGYDVKATRSVYASGQTLKGLSKATDTPISAKDSKTIWGEKLIPNVSPRDTPQAKAEAIFKDLGSNPNGARGELTVGWLMGGGHSVAWEVVNRKPVVFDTQNGKVYKTPKDFAEFTPVVLTAAQTRLDNKPINQEFIKRWVTDV